MTRLMEKFNDSNITIKTLKQLLYNGKPSHFMAYRMNEMNSAAKVLHKLFLRPPRSYTFEDLAVDASKFDASVSAILGLLKHSILLSCDLKLDFVGLIKKTWDKNNAKPNPKRIRDFPKLDLPMGVKRQDYGGFALDDLLTLRQLLTFNNDMRIMNSFISDDAPHTLGQAAFGEFAELDRHFSNHLLESLVQSPEDPMQFKINLAFSNFHTSGEMLEELADIDVFALSFAASAGIDVYQNILNV